MLSSMPTVEAIAPSFRQGSGPIDRVVRSRARFQVDWRAADHAGVRLGAALIVLAQAGPAPAGVSYKGACHLRLASGVDDYAALIETAGQPLTATATDRPEYGMREAAVRDPDGNDIYIGQGL